MSNMMQPQIILLKEGTDDSQGKGQLLTNIAACQAVVETIATTLGPRGMDKLIKSETGEVTISNDGATVLSLLEVVHPAARTVVDIAASQDAVAGDGTTSVVLLAGSFMQAAKEYIQDGVHPQVIIRAFRKAGALCKERIKEICVSVGDVAGSDNVTDLLIKCAGTAMSSKLIHHQKAFFAPMVVEAVKTLDDDLDLNMLAIKKVTGGALQDSILVKGVAFKKTFSYAGFEQQPKTFASPGVLLLNVELELKAEKDNAEIRIDDVSEYQRIVDAEYRIINDKLEAIVATGAKVILSKLPIGDLATQFFADRGLFCAGRVNKADLTRVSRATGASIQTSVNGLTSDVLGTCEKFEEVQVGDERYNFFTGCPESRTATIVLRGGAKQFIDEAERSLHDAIMVVRRAIKTPSVVAGGGAIEMELSRFLREHARTIRGKSQILINAFAKALEVIPRQLSNNAGFDSTDILNKLRQRHAMDDGIWYGVDVTTGDICNTLESFVWEPTLIKLNAIGAAVEATNMILSIDETVKAPPSKVGDKHALPGM
ncbi:T-complex protein 1 subunit eta [Thecamonas trahens ATCC 50062]|uniref:T-complex protein 1 subunit eta n=1 Tax=Thecamonas trahens ATCC 50062 TaxID=461836 RepID=A0A0L0D6E5_THETB|nr:T-complex protein 1 subunit eta [Thecamonas trahens ATCC 50062]KNC47924.1 T-complex protein 1 subunit eta [Thecamonas trahens ATCC 50062]|eukprot:XP_013758943.1 T-complex protein 1 subunit eta [Thecamonas trahens ATCC 50062]